MAHHHKPKVTADGLIFYVDPLNPKSKDKLKQTDLSFTRDSASALRTGRGMDFDGTNDDIAIDPTAIAHYNFGTSSHFTVMGWCNFDDSQQWQSMVGNRKGSGDYNGWAIYAKGGSSWSSTDKFSLVMKKGADNNFAFYADQALGSNQWYHCAVTYAGTASLSACKFYIDGEPVTAAQSFNNLDSWQYVDAPLYIGSRNGGSDYFKGGLSDIRIYNTVLTEGEVKKIYNTSELYPGEISSSQLVGAWPLTEAGGYNCFSISSSTGHTGSLRNGVTHISGAAAGIPLGLTGYSKKLWWNGATVLQGKESSDFAVGTGAYTVAMWYKSGKYNRGGGNYYRRIWSHNNTGNVAGNVQLLPNVTEGRVLVWDDGEIMFSTTNVNDMQWHHLLLTRSGSNMSLRVNGKLEGQATFSETISNNSGKCNPILGAWNYSAVGGMDGYLDEVVFYDTFLTGSDFDLLARSSSAGVPFPLDATTVSGSNLKAYWKNGGNIKSGSWQDRSGNGNDMYVHAGGDEHFVPASGSGRDNNGFPLTNNNDGYIHFYSGSTGNTSDIYFDTNNNIDDITQSTVSYWSRMTDQTGDGKGPFFISDSTGKAIFLSTRADQNYFHVLIETGSICQMPSTSQSQLVDGNWHSIDIVRSGLTLTCYIDGQVIPTSNETGFGSWNVGTNNTVLGGLADNNAIYRYLDCDIACFKIYNRPISKQEIERNFQMQRNRFGV